MAWSGVVTGQIERLVGISRQWKTGSGGGNTGPARDCDANRCDRKGVIDEGLQNDSAVAGV